MPSSALHRHHRARLIERLQQRAAAGIFFTSAHKIRNFDAEYRFRPDSDFWWLSGFAEPDAALVILPASADRAARTLLYLREKDREKEIWSGRRLGLEAAPAALGVDEARNIERLFEDLPALLVNCERIVYRTGVEPERDRRMLEVLATLRARAKGAIVPPLELLDVNPFTHELRLFKQPEELELMRKAAAITREAHTRVMRECRPGVNERELDALLDYTFRARGGNGSAYNNIVAGGANACILHYVENDQPLRDGDLVLIDAGAEFQHYACDVTRTFPVNGSFSPEQRAVYEVVLAAQLAAIAATRAGVSFVSVHERAVQVLCEGFVRLGLLAGTVEEAIQTNSYRRFYMHRTSHWLGLDVHDCGAYIVAGQSRQLEEGMVLTIEPGCYIASDDETVESRWRGIGVRIEDDVLVTAQGCEVLTAGIPKTLSEIESLLAAQRFSAAAAG